MVTIPPLDVCLVDDHSLMRAGILTALSDFGLLRNATQYANGLEFTRHPPDPWPDLIILDYSMPLMNGIQVIKWLNTNRPDSTVLMLSVYNDPKIVLEAMDAGANGYLLKDAHPYEMKEAVQSIIQTDYYLSYKMRKAWQDAPATLPKLARTNGA